VSQVRDLYGLLENLIVAKNAGIGLKRGRFFIGLNRIVNLINLSVST